MPTLRRGGFCGRGVMLRSAPKIYGNYHAYNNQHKREPRSPFTRVSINIESYSISAIAMIDSGCSITIIPSHLIPRDLRGHMSTTSVEIAGIQGSIHASEEVLCDITVSEIESLSFKEIRVLVVSVHIPLLLGQDILSHKSVKEYSIDNANNAITFTRIMGVGEVTHEAALIPKAEEITHQHVAVTSVISPRNVDSLPQKLKWLQEHMNVQLPQHPNRDELEQVADLLIDYQDIIGTEGSEKGTFIRPVRIPMTGASKSQKQHPIAQVMEADVNAEIQRMLSEGIIELCKDPKGFNSLSSQ